MKYCQNTLGNFSSGFFEYKMNLTTMLRRVHLGFPADTHHAFGSKFNPKFCPKFRDKCEIFFLSLGGRPNKLGQVNKGKGVLGVWGEKTRIWVDTPSLPKELKKGRFVKELAMV
jgi:hypothetical protein